MQKPNSQKDYTSFEGSYQVFLPFNLEFQIGKDDPVRLLRHCIGGMDITALEKTYQRINRNLASPRQMLAIIVYAGMNHIFSSRRIELACRRDINFMYLLEGKPVPDHTTIARFRSKHLASCIKELFAQMDFMLEDMGAISLQDIFIDGTKIESVANKYKFVWKKSVQKNQAKLMEKLPDFVDKVKEDFSVSLSHGKDIQLHHLKKLRRKLKVRQKEQGIQFVHGIGKRKTSLQKTMEQLDEFIARLKKYNKYLHIMGNRNSFAKTDTDATFMRMKEDAMKNGQLKPAYNIQYGTDSEFVTWATVGPQPTDTTTLIPFLQELERYTNKRYRNVVADSGYESEENYLYLETNQQSSFIKPSNYEKSKTRKWKQDIGRRENMTYLADEDAYLCAQGRKLTVTKEFIRKSKTGFHSQITHYSCENCKDCPVKSQCIHGNHCKTPLEERTKNIEVSKRFQRQRQEALERITSPEGIQLRVNRSIQAEGAFAMVKADMTFRRFLTRGNKNVLVETMLLAMAYNIQKLHCKIQAEKLNRHRIPVDNAA